MSFHSPSSPNALTGNGDGDPALWVYRFAEFMGRLVLGLALASFIVGMAQVLLILLIYLAGVVALRYAVSACLKIAKLGKARAGDEALKAPYRAPTV